MSKYAGIIRFASWALLSLAFLVASISCPLWYPFGNEANVQVVLFKTALALGAGYAGFWLGVHAFPEEGTNALPRSIVMAAVIIGICLGL